MTIEIATSSVQDIGQAVTGTIESLWPVIILVISVPLAFYVMRKIAQMFPKR